MTGTVSVTAIDASAIVTVAGGLAVAVGQNTGAGAVGAAVDYNDIVNTVTAEITGSTVQGPQNNA